MNFRSKTVINNEKTSKNKFLLHSVKQTYFWEVSDSKQQDRLESVGDQLLDSLHQDVDPHPVDPGEGGDLLSPLGVLH